MECSIVRDGCEYVINGTKWWSSGAGDPRCKVYIVMGLTPNADKPMCVFYQNTHMNKCYSPLCSHKQHSMVIVPANTPGVTVIRPLHVFGFDGG